MENQYLMGTMMTGSLELVDDNPNYVSPYSYNGTYRPWLDCSRNDEEEDSHQNREVKVDESLKEEPQNVAIDLEQVRDLNHII